MFIESAVDGAPSARRAMCLGELNAFDQRQYQMALLAVRSACSTAVLAL